LGVAFFPPAAAAFFAGDFLAEAYKFNGNYLKKN
jgi:hypothetical protein